MDAALTAPHGPIWYGATVLVVDDVRTAADGQAAITMLEGLGTLPAIVVTDLQMRGGSGEELARVLARRYPDLPVIFMTAYLARYRTAYLPGPILEKPFRADQLCELLGSVLTAASELRAYGKSTAGHSLGRRRQASASDALSATAKPDWVPDESRRRR